MTIHVSQQTEARLTEEAHRQGLSVDALVERLISERTASAPIAASRPATPTVFEQGLGMFGSPEDAVLINEVVSLAYAERRTRATIRQQPQSTPRPRSKEPRWN